MHRILLAAAAASLLGTAPAFAATVATSPEQITGTTRLYPDLVTSMAQLQTLLEGRGYTNILLSAQRPNLENPRPDIQSSGAAASFDPQRTAVHPGWNGTAITNGHRVNIVIAKG